MDCCSTSITRNHARRSSRRSNWPCCRYSHPPARTAAYSKIQSRIAALDSRGKQTAGHKHRQSNCTKTGANVKWSDSSPRSAENSRLATMKDSRSINYRRKVLNCRRFSLSHHKTWQFRKTFLFLGTKPSTAASGLQFFCLLN